MKKFLLVAVSLITMFFGSAKIAHASQSGLLDFGDAISAKPASVGIAANPPSNSSASSSSVAQAATPELSFSPPSQKTARLENKQPEKKAALVTPHQSSRQSFASSAIADSINAIFEGGSNSIVARTVGHAEGTRSVDGSKTRAYYGHVDPGNGVWNLGSFSYQHCDASCTPDEADDRQLRRLRSQSQVLAQRADSNGIRMTLEEKLNGIDLANQAPLAALDQGGYVDWLRAAHQKGLTGSNAVLWARTYSFLNPRTQTWDAPGLGNRYDSIAYDQERRRAAIASALENHNQQRSQTARSDSMPSTVAQLKY
ncbi:hypothetical protein [Phormidesmis priestleyi]|uniref:hypothetical protein n=1 Tax=Phormidesmis priestleyi TaxID=268141 RepID=UPI000AFBB4AE|nr:hypothetical protein [Phormidesmis priestleyi]